MWNFLFAAFSLAGAAASAAGQLEAGKAEQRAAEQEAFNIETERTRSKVEALQRHNDRLDQYRENLKANIATFAATGREVSGSQSVKAFLDRQKEIASQDVQRSDLMGSFEQSKLIQEAAATRSEGRARRRASQINAFTTITSGLADYSRIRIG